MTELWTSTLGLTINSVGFNDVRYVDPHVVVHHAMDGTIYAHRSKARWGLKLRFSTLSRQEALDLHAFLEQSAGLDVWIRMHDGVRWRGKILNGTIETVDSGRDVGEVSFDFEGERLP